MSVPTERDALLLQALDALSAMEARLTAAERTAGEPLAIVGMACRTSGGCDDPARLWTLVERGGDASGPMPAHRRQDFDAADEGSWAEVAGEARGGFLEDVAGFDAAFFGISSREAAWIDPQQRLLLEVCWEALEDAGQVHAEPLASATGVFVGVMNQDYAIRLARGVEASELDAHLGSGNDASFAPGRISHLLGLGGPSLAVNTACSSSLVALHLACRSLRSGECRMALAGGVNLILAPDGWVTLSRAGALAPDGRCKTFAADADGYGRGEGCAIVVLKRLSDAVAAGDRVLALVRGSAVNHGARGAGLTVPNGVAQQAVIRAALRDAGVSADTIAYVEAHGTGTALGDPIEVHALGEVFAGRQGEPLLVGSVKANIGHTESAAGILGLVKVVLALQHERIPAQPRWSGPSRHIDWASLPLRVAEPARHWRRESAPRRGAVSSFGMSGTNAHVIVEEAPADRLAETAGEVWHLLPLSARDPVALQQLAVRLRDQVERGAPPLGDLCWSAGARRMHHPYRAAFVFQDVRDLCHALDDLADGRRPRRGDLGWIRGRGERGARACEIPAPESSETGREERVVMLEALAALYVAGGVVNWTALEPGDRRFVQLPRYPWQHRRHWIAARRPIGMPRVLRSDGVDSRPRRALLVDELAALPHDRRLAVMRARILALLGEVLRWSPDERSRAIDRPRGFQELGLDSILAAELVRRLSEELDTSYDTVIVYERPDVDSLARFLTGDLGFPASRPAAFERDELAELERELASSGPAEAT